MVPRALFRFWSAWLIGGLLAALLWYEPLLNSFWGSLAEMFIFGIFVSLPLAWFLTKLAKKKWALDWRIAARVIAVMAFLFFIFYSAFIVRKHDNFFTGYDLSIFDQAIWRMSRLQIPESTIRNVPWVFGDHFDPIIALLTPVYALFPDARTLLVAQVFLLVAGVAIIYLWSKKEKITPFLAVLVSLLYLAHPGIQGAVNCDFHEIAFAPLLILVIFYFLSRKKWRSFFISAFLLLLVKEEFALWVAAIGVYVVLREKQIRVGVGTLMMGVVYFLLLMNVFMPALNSGGPGYAYGNLFPGFENGFGAGISYYAHDSAKIVEVVAQNPDKWWTIALYVLPLAVPLFFDFLGIILFLPAVATRVLSSYKYLSYAGLYYNAVFAALAVVILVRFLASEKMAAWRTKASELFGRIGIDFPIWVLAAAISVNLFYSYGYSYLLDPVYNWRSIDRQYKAERLELIAQIPAAAIVSASSYMLPHLSQRQNLYILPRISDAEYVIFDYCEENKCNYWPTGLDNMTEIHAFLEQNPLYRIKAENQAGIVFERTGPISESQRAELVNFCHKIIDQSELEPIHRQYLSVNCEN